MISYDKLKGAKGKAPPEMTPFISTVP